MSNVRGIGVIVGNNNLASVILLTPTKGRAASAAFLKVEGVRLAEYLDRELSDVTGKALTRRLAELHGLIGEDEDA